MESYRSSRLRSLWTWLGVLVAGTRGSQKRLYLSLERLYANQNPVPGHRTFYRGLSDHVLRLLYRDTERAPGGLGPSRVISSRAVADEDTWFVSGDSDPAPIIGDSTGHSPASHGPNITEIDHCPVCRVPAEGEQTVGRDSLSTLPSAMTPQPDTSEPPVDWDAGPLGQQYLEQGPRS